MVANSACASSSVLPGGSRPLLIELPPYRAPSLWTATLHTFDRAKIFVKQAGTIILLVSLVLCCLGAGAAARTISAWALSASRVKPRPVVVTRSAPRTI